VCERERERESVCVCVFLILDQCQVKLGSTATELDQIKICVRNMTRPMSLRRHITNWDKQVIKLLPVLSVMKWPAYSIMNFV